MLILFLCLFVNSNVVKLLMRMLMLVMVIIVRFVIGLGLCRWRIVF